ncbi:glycosyltransferase [Caulobacter henricii]|uniref:glycosyltransferase n=1 Tax=Caulobacter henricii TaxID=69395 RepID=UPI000A055CBD|nr:glycosyltransferase [Caulobacter henricii]
MSEPTQPQQPLKILLVTEPSGGGSGRHVVDLARELLLLGHIVAVIYSPVRAELKFIRELRGLSLMALEALPMRRAVGPWDIGCARELRRAIDRLGPFDVIHAHSSKAGALARLVAPSGTLRVYTPHAFRTMDPATSNPARLVYGSVEALLGRFVSDAIIAVSSEEADHAGVLGIPLSKIHTVANGLTPAPIVDREAARAALGLQAGDIAVGFVGRLCEQKNPERFAEAICLANALDPRIRGVILGDGELLEVTMAAGGKALSVFSGFNAREYLPAFDLFVMTSRYEAMPYVLLEALQAGLPIISTAVGGTSFAVKHGENGSLLDVNASPQLFADAIIQNAPAELRAVLGKASKAKCVGITALDMAQATTIVYRMAAQP